MRIHITWILALGILGIGRPLVAQVASGAQPPTESKKKILVCPGGPECLHCEDGCEIKVSLQMDNGQCQVKGLTKWHKIYHIKVGKKAHWVFTNKCDSSLELGIGHFGRHAEETCTGSDDRHKCHMTEEIDSDPFQPGRRSVQVRPGETKTLTLAILKDAWRPRTYKYAIMVNGKPELDPEIEIERQN